jgi:hypothetical protein
MVEIVPPCSFKARKEMSRKMRVGAVRASAIAAANAVVGHLGLGLFISEFTISEYSQLGIFRNRTFCGVNIEGRTNAGHKVKHLILVVFKPQENIGRDLFPVERVFVGVDHSAPSGCSRTYYECFLDFMEELRVNEVRDLPEYLT